MQSRTGNECCSISTDGQLLWWDIRKLRKGYTDSMWLEGEGGVRYGGMSLEYKSDAGATRFLVGTEQGVAMLCDRKAKKDSESTKSVKSYYGLTGGAHVGPIYSIQRNPFNLKYFLTAGDWSTKVWMEDLKEPIITNPYSRAYITAAAWSTARPAVYYVARSDGCMDVHDLYHRQESPVYTLKVSDAVGGLTAMRMSGGGRLIAVGDGLGSVNVVQVSKGLVEQQKDEKSVIAAMFERETKREKALEVRKHSSQTRRHQTNHHHHHHHQSSHSQPSHSQPSHSRHSHSQRALQRRPLQPRQPAHSHGSGRGAGGRGGERGVAAGRGGVLCSDC